LAPSKIDPVDADRAARILGRRGGQARAERLSAEERRRIASLGGQARMRAIRIVRRMADTLDYAAAVAELQGRPAVVRMKTFKGPLPGLYPGRR
jgi:hypothetical protein